MDRVMEESRNRQPDDRGRILEHLGGPGDQLAQHTQRRLDIGSVRDPNRQVQLWNRAEVVQNFSDDFSIRDDDPGVIRVHERGREDIDLDDITMDSEERHMFSDSVGFGEDDRQTGNDIAQDALQGETDTEVGHAKPGDQRRDLQAELAQRDQKAEDHHQGLHDAQKQQAEWRLHVLLIQPALEETPARLCGEQGGHDDKGSPHDPEAVWHDVLCAHIGQRYAPSP